MYMWSEVQNVETRIFNVFNEGKGKA